MLRKSVPLSLIIVFIFVGAIQAMAGADPLIESKFAPALLKIMKASPSSNIPSLVFMKEQADLSRSKDLRTKRDKTRYVYKKLTEKALATQGDLVEWLDEQELKYRRYYVVNLIAVFDATAAQLREIAARDDVGKINADQEFRLDEPSEDKALISFVQLTRGVGANIESTGATKVWEEYSATGEGIVIGAQDTGIDWDHPALINQYRGWDGEEANHDFNWHDSIQEPISSSNNSCGYGSLEPCDDNGHGTHTLGTVVGDDGDSNQIGMAPGAKWIGCRNMDAGDGRSHAYIECFEFFLAPYPVGGNAMTDGDPELSADVLNNSWGCPGSEGCKGDEFVEVLENLYAAGIMTVVSAGNEGSSCGSIQDAPAHNSATTLSVGAIDHRNDRIAYFSSRGPSSFDDEIGPDVTAPGMNVRSSTRGGGYAGFMWSGTSMAGPHVAGQVALLWSADETLVGQIEETVNLVRESAKDTTSSQTCGGVAGSEVPNNTFGWGIMDAFEAVKSRFLEEDNDEEEEFFVSFLDKIGLKLKL